jgi:hypothetical protein
MFKDSIKSRDKSLPNNTTQYRYRDSPFLAALASGPPAAALRFFVAFAAALLAVFQF